MKRYLWMLTAALLPMMFAACGDDNDAKPDIFGEDDYVFPSLREATVAPGESFVFKAECSLPFSLSLPNYLYFYLLDEDGQERSMVSCEGGSVEAEVFARNVANFDDDISEMLSMTVGSRTQDVVRLSLARVSRELTVSTGVYDYDDYKWVENEYSPVAAGEPLTFVFNRSRDAYELPILVECSFTWGFDTDIDWIDPESLVTAQNDPRLRRLTVAADKLNLDGMSGTLTFTAATGATQTVPVGEYEFRVPSSRDICYAYFDYYTGTPQTISFTREGDYNSSSGAVSQSATGVLVAPDVARIAVVGPSEDGTSLSRHDDMATLGAWDASLPNLKRTFTFTPGANRGYNRTLTLLAFPGEVPADLVEGGEINAAYEGNIFARAVQSGELGRADGAMLNFVEGSAMGYVFGEEMALSLGLKHELLGDDAVAAAIRTATGIDDLEVWRLTFKRASYAADADGYNTMPVSFYGSFYFTGYETASLSPDIDSSVKESIYGELGIATELTSSMEQNTISSPNGWYFSISPAGESREECVTIVSAGTKPVAGFHLVYDPAAIF